MLFLIRTVKFSAAASRAGLCQGIKHTQIHKRTTKNSNRDKTWRFVWGTGEVWSRFRWDTKQTPRRFWSVRQTSHTIPSESLQRKKDTGMMDASTRSDSINRKNSDERSSTVAVQVRGSFLAVPIGAAHSAVLGKLEQKR